MRHTAKSAIFTYDTVALLANISDCVIYLVVRTADLVGEGGEDSAIAVFASLGAIDVETPWAADWIIVRHFLPIANHGTGSSSRHSVVTLQVQHTSWIHTKELE